MIIPWTEITLFNNVRKYTQSHPEILNGNSVVTYRAKIKMHGTNAAVQVHSDGTVVAQSRENIITPEKDNAGFSKWVESNKTKWASIADDTDEEYVIFGEWIGPKIQKNVAASEIPRKVFAVFAARHISSEDDSLIVEPYLLQELVKDIPDTYVLPWHNIQLEINWTSSVEELTLNVNVINEWVMEVEKNDPWVENIFGVKGTGEGLVFYPTSKEHLGLKNFNNLVFKAKGEKHKNIKSAAPAQVNAQAVANIQQFVDMVLTEARLEQGAQLTQVRDGSSLYEMKQLGPFLKWVTGDVQKETQDELEASGLTWDQVSKAVGNAARAWYLAKAKAL